MRVRPAHQYRAFTLLEILLVLGIVVLISAMAIPTFIDEFRREELPGSGRQLRSLLTLVAANASFDGKRYRVRFPKEDETDALGGDRQPLVEREDDPFEQPEVYNMVTLPWAVGNTLLDNVRCAEVRLGRPTIEQLRRRRNEIEDIRKEAADLEKFSPVLLPLVFEPDGTSDWATFVLVANAPRDVDIDELDNYERIEVIYEGETGFAWLQRPFYEEELDLFEEKNWPVVLRTDFLRRTVLTEDDVLELRDFRIRDAAPGGAGSALPPVEGNAGSPP
ncbi:MAG: Tfp pilus assembly protein FimT/FimU [Phycisphaerae bacterium]